MNTMNKRKMRRETRRMRNNNWATRMKKWEWGRRNQVERRKSAGEKVIRDTRRITTKREHSGHWSVDTLY